MAGEDVLALNQRDRDRLKELHAVIRGRQGVCEAARHLGLSPRQKLFHTHGTSPPTPKRWSVSEMMTLLPDTDSACPRHHDSSLRVRPRISSHFGACAGRADAGRRAAGDGVTSSRSGNAADARPPPRPGGLAAP